MAGMFTAGETKVRPGAYSNIQKSGGSTIAGAVDGVTAVLFRSDWGPLGQAVIISAEDGYETVYGNGVTTDALKEAVRGGAKTLVCCRVGTGGNTGSVKLLAGESQEAVSITGRYPGEKAFTATVRDSLTDLASRECIIYTGTKEFERFIFSKGGNEAKALCDAVKSSPNFVAAVIEDGGGVLQAVSQKEFTGGENPAVTNESYSEALTYIEAHSFNTLCVDTTSAAVHTLAAAFLERIIQVGQFAQLIVAGDTSISFNARMVNAKSFNNEKVVYAVNPHVKTANGELKGYQVAARIAGMVASVPSNKSLTHTVIEGATELGEAVTPSQITAAELSGCLVLSKNKSGQIWIDSGINTLCTLSEDQDEGWKKIRRTKTRYELLNRASTQADNLVGKVDNDSNGRAAIVAQVQGVVDAMCREGKLSSGAVTEGASQSAMGDSCWFDIDVMDKDSAEHIYLTFKFSFVTE